MKTLKELLSEKPVFDTSLTLKIEALVPLAMNNSVPGKYYPSFNKPSESMIHGLIENAMGLYLDDASRTTLGKITKKSMGETLTRSVSKFISVLQHHIKIDSISEPFVMRYSDCFSQQFSNREQETHLKGGANHCYSVIKEIHELEKITELDAKRLKKSVSRFYSSLSRREYVIPQEPYTVKISTSKDLASIIAIAVEDPESPLFLGTNDGWVDAEVVND
jgi:CRISPR-associated protein Cas5